MSTIAHYRTMLPVHKHRLDDELEIQPDIMDRISTQLVIMNSRMLQAKDDLAQLEGRLADDERENDPKASIGVIDSRVKRDSKRIVAWAKYQDARATHESWLGLLDAWKQKGYAIKTLADLYAANYFSMNSHQVSARQRARDEQGDEARAAMRRAGHRARGVDAGETAAREAEPTKSTRRTLT